MKKIFTSLFLFSLLCSNAQAAIVTKYFTYQMMTSSDDNGDTFWQINSKAAFTDVMLSTEICFAGQEYEVCQVLKALAHNNRLQYADGGHFLVEDLQCSMTANQLKISYLEISDYADQAQNKERVLSRCR